MSECIPHKMYVNMASIEECLTSQDISDNEMIPGPSAYLLTRPFVEIVENINFRNKFGQAVSGFRSTSAHIRHNFKRFCNVFNNKQN